MYDKLIIKEDIGRLEIFMHNGGLTNFMKIPSPRNQMKPIQKQYETETVMVSKFEQKGFFIITFYALFSCYNSRYILFQIVLTRGIQNAKKIWTKTSSLKKKKANNKKQKLK